MFTYSATVSFDEENNQYEISFRDFDNLHAVAFTEDDIELDALDALLAGIGELIETRSPVPAPTAGLENDIRLPLPVLASLKIALSNAMLTTGTAKSQLARKLGLNGPQTDRLLDVSYASKVELLEQALYLLDYEVTVSVTPLH
ncbi:hypothetical protein MUA04_22530 [Enterobacteriaceae bacterium H11S18]|uniref:hypothetical protein n=1 Tax=Dryocola clanedunensis TaxID=2925396 RepID=UPI0022F075D1|nr:hypothetical protein [Dryocola clanedunensis]MCT4706199.1 hypothetical protein [Dryocola clanedunensis]MCT4712947.1 hypothetical protein [Dryocola clanedunensis]